MTVCFRVLLTLIVGFLLVTPAHRFPAERLDLESPTLATLDDDRAERRAEDARSATTRSFRLADLHGSPTLDTLSTSQADARATVDDRLNRGTRWFRNREATTPWAGPEPTAPSLGTISPGQGLFRVVGTPQNQRVPVVDVSAPRPANQTIWVDVAALEPAAPPTPGPEPRPDFAHHVVRPGETIAQIAARYQVSTDQLIRGNALRQPEHLAPGTLLAVEPATLEQFPRRFLRHRVQSGETVDSLARQYGIPIERLRQLNALGTDDAPAPGQEVIVDRPPEPATPAIGPSIAEAAIARWQPIVETFARQHGVDPGLAIAVLAEESHGDPNRQSPAGAIGLMQVLPSTFAEVFPEGNPWDPVQNIDGGIRYLKKALQAFEGDPCWGTAAYNAGIPSAQEQRAAPGYVTIPETVRYVRAVLERAGITRSDSCLP